MPRGRVPYRDFNKLYEPEPNSGCWLWIGSLAPGGYGKHSSRWAHRVSYQRHIGPIPEGLHIDHLCRNRQCVNPAHLEAVTCRENLLRGPNAMKTACLRGHPYSKYGVSDRGGRSCRKCDRMRSSAARRRVPLKRVMHCGRCRATDHNVSTCEAAS